MSIGIWLRGARPKTLPASVAPVVVGAAAGWERLWNLEAGGGDATLLTSRSQFVIVTVLCAFVALFMQIAVNYANDYSDGVRGLDDERGDSAGGGETDAENSTGKMDSGEVGTGEIGEMDSGKTVVDKIIPGETSVERKDVEGKGVEGTARETSSNKKSAHAPTRLVASGVPARQVLLAAGCAALIACLCGIAVIAITGYWWFLIVGVCCLVAGWFYTGGKKPYGYAGFGELAVFVFFGLVAVLGTEYAVSGGIDVSGVFGAVYCGVLSCVLLMVNNVRDIDSDRIHGKRTLAVRMGGPVARWFLMFVYCVAVLSVVVIVEGRAILALLQWFGLFCDDGTLVDGDACLSIPPSPDEIVSGVLGILLLIVGIVMVRALLRRNYAKALPLSSLTLLLYALTFVALMPSVAAAALPVA